MSKENELILDMLDSHLVNFDRLLCAMKHQEQLMMELSDEIRMMKARVLLMEDRLEELNE